MATTRHEQPTRELSGGGTVPQLCPSCAAPLADDQRWCLNCGRRLGDGRADLRDALAPPPAPAAIVPPPPPAGPLLRSGLGGGALAAALLAGLVLGALLLAGDEEKQDVVVNVPRQEAPRVNVSVPAGGAVAAPADIASDWPGDDGWTVQLSTLPKEGTTQAQVDQAKADATGKGADDVGIADPDDYASLDPEGYVVYSGVFKTRKAAQKALPGLRKDFPDAKVVRVAASGGAAPKVEKDAKKASDEELANLEKASGDDFVKKSKKLKDKVGTEGKAPPKDAKPAGGGEDEGAVIE